MCILVLQLQRQILIPGDMGGVVRDTEMPHAEPEVEQPGGGQIEEEQPEREPPMGEPEIGGSMDVVRVDLLRVDDSPLPTVPGCVAVPPHGDDRVRYSAGHS